jgi:hypothetical protein
MSTLTTSSRTAPSSAKAGLALTLRKQPNTPKRPSFLLALLRALGGVAG